MSKKCKATLFVLTFFGFMATKKKKEFRFFYNQKLGVIFHFPQSFVRQLYIGVPVYLICFLGRHKFLAATVSKWIELTSGSDFQLENYKENNPFGEGIV